MRKRERRYRLDTVVHVLFLFFNCYNLAIYRFIYILNCSFKYAKIFTWKFRKEEEKECFFLR